MTEQNQLNWQRTNLDNIEEAWEGDLWVSSSPIMLTV